MQAEEVASEQVVAFWREAGPRQWFKKKPEFDQSIREGFEAAHLAAAQGALSAWEARAEGSLALLLLTDQFPRNLYRNSAHAFATDPMAREVAGRALAHGFDQRVEGVLRPFFYLPFSHHENLGSQARAVELFERHAEATGDTESLRYACIHADVVTRFGRFPHRNVVMGRHSTAEETAFLQRGGFSG